jgi:pyruvate dehydrogenase E2 component (dihydrolipoamide acetyltransferase)
MPVPIAMPKLGMTMQEGTVVEWRTAPGEAVVRGQVVLSIESEKAEMEIEAPGDGILRHVYVLAGETVPCGTLLAALTATAEEAFDAEGFRREAGPPPRAGTPAAGATMPAPASPPPRPTGALPVTPAARRRARELDVDPASVTGSGPGGRVTREDVEAHVAALAARIHVADGAALEVTRSGTGEAVVLLPGFGTDVSAFARQVPRLAERHLTVGVNLRGIGLSDAPAGSGYGVEEAAADVLAVVDALRGASAVGPGPVHLLGASLGAAIAIEVALARPGDVRSLTLLTPFIDAGARLRAVLEAWCRLATEAAAETLASVLVPWLFSPMLLADEGRRSRAVRALAQAVRRVPAPTLERARRGLVGWSGTRGRDLRRISVPTLVVTAAEDLLTPPEDGETIAAAIPGARSVVIPGAGHAVGLEAADAVNEALAAHLHAARAGG